MFDTKILKIDDFSLREAADLLNNGELVAFPTETVYGLGAIGTLSEAVKKIYEVKGRPNDNPLIAHVHKGYDIDKLVIKEQDYIDLLIEKFMPGPLTLVMYGRGVISKEATCGGDTLAIRMPSHEGAQRFLEYVDQPIVAPSANVSKHVSPVTAMHVFEDLNGRIPLILDGGKSQGGIESTVLDVTEKVPRILRAGLVTREMIAETVGACLIAEHKEGDKIKSPGVKYGHYMPKCLTARFSEGEIDRAILYYDYCLQNNQKPVFLCEDKIAVALSDKNKLNLGATPEEVAFNLYDKLREGEKIADVIIAIEPENSGGVYDGILNRLNKSCKKL